MSDRLISEKMAIDAADKIIKRDTSGNNDVVKAMTAWKSYIEQLPSAEPQTEINMAYMRGKIDGINYCTERLRKMRMEVDNENNH